MIRIAAVGDIHVDASDRGRFRPAFLRAREHADLLLLAGDLTRHGTPEEAAAVAHEVTGLGLPVLAVLGNHDYHSDAEAAVSAELRACGVTVLEGTGEVLEIRGVRVGVAGTKGFGTGFPGKQASEFGEPEMKAFVRHSHALADAFGAALLAMDCDVRVALTHYSPVKDTLRGEPPEIHPFLGSYHLAEAIDAARADIALHGHAHRGTAKGLTPGGVRVRNVALPVIQSAYAVFDLAGPGAPRQAQGVARQAHGAEISARGAG